MAVILIVEDEPLVRRSAEWTIEDLGHDTLLASDLGPVDEVDSQIT
jgi:CheY-like chemotaxis protein